MKTKDACRSAKKRGFTLIELLVSLAVLAIIVTIAVPAFRGFLERNRFAAAYNEALSALNFAKSQSVTQRAGFALVLEDDEEGSYWRVSRILDDEDKTIDETAIREFRSKMGGVQVEFSDGDVRFDRLGRAISCPSGCEIKVSVGSLERTLLVFGSGQVFSND